MTEKPSRPRFGMLATDDSSIMPTALKDFQNLLTRFPDHPIN
jgi:hypothetical protein